MASWCPHVSSLGEGSDLPAEVSRSAFGTRLQAWVAILTGRFRQSRRQVSELLRELVWRQRQSGECPSPVRRNLRGLWQSPYQEAQEAVAQADMALVDETGWKEQGKRRWLWVAVTTMGDGLHDLVLPGPQRFDGTARRRFCQGILHSDRWGAYNIVDNRRRQLCWAHLKRDFQALSERKTRAGPSGRMGTARDQTALCHLASLSGLVRSPGPECDGNWFQCVARLGRLLRQGASCGDPKAEAMCRNLLKLWPALLTFAFVPGVEPTNNRAERALRGAVLWRKGCFGNQSENGSRFTARILTTVTTLRQQERNIVEYIVEAIQAHRTGQLAPSLLPVAPLLHRGGLNDYLFYFIRFKESQDCFNHRICRR